MVEPGVASEGPSSGAALRAVLVLNAERWLGEGAVHLLGLRQFEDPLLVAAHDQVTSLAELAGLPNVELAATEYTIPYVVLMTHCDLLDDAVDGQADTVSALLAVADTLLLFWLLAENELLPRVAPADRETWRARIAARLADRTAALRLETERRGGWAAPAAADDRVAVNRSGGVLLIFELLCAVAGREPEPAILAVLTDVLLAAQASDDLNDWEEDLAAGNHTGLLRRCAADLATRQPPADNRLARDFLLGGQFEASAARLVRDFDDLLARLTALDGVRADGLRAYLAARRSEALAVLSRVVRLKLEALDGEPAHAD